MNRSSGWMYILAALLVLAGLAVLGAWSRRTPADRCALDGDRIEPLYRVRILDEHDQSHAFCCLRCAELWLERHPSKPRSILVTDEVSGQEIDAADAFFVRSRVITQAATGSRIHVFRDRSAAEQHASHFGGRLLQEADRPFAWYKPPPRSDYR